MKIWKLVEDVNNYAVLALKDEDNILNVSDQFNKNSELKDEWLVAEVKIFKNDDKKQVGDFFDIITGVWAFNENALKLIKDYIADGKSEVLPLKGEEEPYYLLNVFNYVDCIDVDKSQVRYFRNSDRVMSISNYVFKPNMLNGEHIFKSTLQKRGPIFISDELKEKLEKSGLKGFRFDEAWDSEK
ncbi:hypothetical protein Q6375_14125 [Clostridium septicum]|uniref:imm11 family protein n=1 Tax=Clostridium septicum TaxID=1504 RepID=UPI00272E2787|nr:DUF1629 domain-containing protein [Clostridium septicum]WLF69099.1 hypothetical protein Q6375_14125 [Clostridium septicum]